MGVESLKDLFPDIIALGLWLNIKMRFLLECGHNKDGIWSLKEI